MNEKPPVNVVTVVKDGQPYTNYDPEVVSPETIGKHLAAFESGVAPHFIDDLGGFGLSMRVGYVVDGESWTALVLTRGIRENGTPNYVNIHAFRNAGEAGDAFKVVVETLEAVRGHTV